MPAVEDPGRTHYRDYTFQVVRIRNSVEEGIDLGEIRRDYKKH